MKKTIIITGGCGFIGTNIALLAKKRGYKVVIFDSLIRAQTEDNAAILQKENIEIIRGDVREQNDLIRLPNNAQYIIHLAANAGIPWSIKWPVYDFMTNAVGTVNLLEFAKTHGMPVIFASSDKVYSEEMNILPYVEKETRYVWDASDKKNKNIRTAVRDGVSQKGINENFPLDSAGLFPHTPYGLSKAAADLYCQEYFHIYGLPTVVNRMSLVYGFYQKGVEEQGWIDWFVRAKINNLPLNIFGDGKQVRDCMFGSDIAELYLLEIEQIDKIKGSVFNVGGGVSNTISLLEAIDYLNKKGGKKLKTTFHPWRQHDRKICISDSTKIKEMLSWEPTINILHGIDKLWQFSTQ